jgi:hypothetical protein
VHVERFKRGHGAVRRREGSPELRNTRVLLANDARRSHAHDPENELRNSRRVSRLNPSRITNGSFPKTKKNPKHAKKTSQHDFVFGPFAIAGPYQRGAMLKSLRVDTTSPFGEH